MSRKARKQADEAAIDLTPMLDIVFIMLIFFIVTTSFVKESGVDVTRPSANTAERKERGNIIIAIRPNGDVWMDKRNVDVRSVRANVELTSCRSGFLGQFRPQSPVLLEQGRKGLVGSASCSFASEVGAQSRVLRDECR